MTAHDPLPRRTPLYEAHRRLGAAMTDFGLPFYRRPRGVPGSYPGK